MYQSADLKIARRGNELYRRRSAGGLKSTALEPVDDVTCGARNQQGAHQGNHESAWHTVGSDLPQPPWAVSQPISGGMNGSFPVNHLRLGTGRTRGESVRERLQVGPARA